MVSLDTRRLSQSLSVTPLFQQAGRLRSVTNKLTSSIRAAVGDVCTIIAKDNQNVLAEVIGFENGQSYLVPFDNCNQLQPGSPVIRKSGVLTIPTGPGLLGRVVDGLGRPYDSKGPLSNVIEQPINRPAPAALQREDIHKPFVTGIRAIDGLLTLGRGQRVGIFAGSGVGKSTLLGEIAKRAESEVNVIALIGERGREVKPFLEKCLGEEGMAKSVVVIATCEQTPLMRVRATQAAISIADSFRAEGKNVLLMVDSITRLAIAQRELGQMLGEPPGSKGFTSSVFQLLANSVERLGNSDKGGITALLTVLVEGGDMDEPVADYLRGLVDGHIVLNRSIGERGIYPAIDVSKSVSRVAHEITTDSHRIAARKMRAIMSSHADILNLIRIGQYKEGSDPQADMAVKLMPDVIRFLKQEIGESCPLESTITQLERITAGWKFT